MLPLTQALDASFDRGDPWIRAAIGALGDLVGPTTLVHAVSRGWVGLPSGERADVLFLLLSDRLALTGSDGDTAQAHWIPLGTVRFLDLADTQHPPLTTVEMVLDGDQLVIAAWSQEFCDDLVAVLGFLAAAERTHDAMAPELTDPTLIDRDPGALDLLPPAAFEEPALTDPAVDVPAFAGPAFDGPALIDQPFDEDEFDEAAFDEPFLSTHIEVELTDDAGVDAQAFGAFVVGTSMGDTEVPEGFDRSVDDRPAAPMTPPMAEIGDESPSSLPSFLASAEPGSAAPAAFMTPIDWAAPDALDDGIAPEPAIDRVEAVDAEDSFDDIQPFDTSVPFDTNVPFDTEPLTPEDLLPSWARGGDGMDGDGLDRLDSIAAPGAFGVEPGAFESPAFEPIPASVDPGATAPVHATAPLGAPVEDGQARGPWLAEGLAWPEPIKSVSYLGGVKALPRKRKNGTLVFGPKGLLAAGTGFQSWDLLIEWSTVETVEVMGPDEVAFTEQLKVDINSSVLAVTTIDGDRAQFEVRMRRPPSLRTALVPVFTLVERIRAHRAA